MSNILIFVVILSCLTNEAFLWTKHDISTLKLLQIVHRHGDRTPIEFVGRDPFQNVSTYWPEGLGELTNQGRLRMYKLGQFIREEYNEFLGKDYSPREVYVRSSVSSRCIESASLLLSGAYPPNNTKWQWNNGSDAQLGRVWQPFPIESYIPKDNDTLLNVDKHCPKAEEEFKKIFNSEVVLKFFEQNKDFLDELSLRVGIDMKDLKLGDRLYEDMKIEQNRGLKWSDMKVLSPEFERKVFNKLQPLARLRWNVEWDNLLIERVRAGPLVHRLVDNFHTYIEGKPIENSAETPYKVFVYSTHDSKLAVLMNALNIFNNQLIPFGATLLIELHESVGALHNYFVKIYYFNETLSGLGPHLMTLKDCDNREDCPFDKFYELTRKVIPEDWDNECGIHKPSPGSIFISNIVALVINLLLIIILSSLIIYNCYNNNNNRSSYMPLEA